MTDIDIGQRLKQIRKAHKLSQRELANRAGTTNGTISLIESNKLNPTVGLLRSLLQQLDISMSEFFREGETQRDQVFFDADEFLELGSGPISIRQVKQDLQGHSLQVCRESYAPGADTGPELFSHNGEEGGIVISGEIELTVGEQCKVLKPGQAYFFNSELPHRFRNLDKESECVIVSAVTPPTF
ncbi:MAG: cupin domain-containing protein [Pseudomonadales bacterium]